MTAKRNRRRPGRSAFWIPSVTFNVAVGDIAEHLGRGASPTIGKPAPSLCTRHFFYLHSSYISTYSVARLLTIFSSSRSSFLPVSKVGNDET